MSRSLGLREDQREGQVLAERIAFLFSLERALPARRRSTHLNRRRTESLAGHLSV
ncbi:hypothetical protein PMI35_01944 [Pseudomonas sp. GM78]|nr:hypothetical protein PMI35_01944 [Pseudomonas sp. GM78]